LVLLFWAPVDEVAGVEGDAEEVGGDEAELGGADANDADDGAVDTGDDPALPELLADEDGSEHGQNAREIIQSNHVEQVQHGGPMSQGQRLMEYSASELTFMALLLKLVEFAAWAYSNGARGFGE